MSALPLFTIDEAREALLSSENINDTKLIALSTKLKAKPSSEEADRILEQLVKIRAASSPADERLALVT